MPKKVYFILFASRLHATKTDAAEVPHRNPVGYPSIVVIARSNRMNSMGNNKHLEVLQMVFQRFDKMCDSNSVSTVVIFQLDFDRICCSSFELFAQFGASGLNLQPHDIQSSTKQVNSDASFSEFTRMPDQEPDYWIIRWTYDNEPVGGFAYQTSDHSIGMLFTDGFRFVQTPDKA